MWALHTDHSIWEYDEHDNAIRTIHDDIVSGDLQADESGNLQRVSPKSFRREARLEYKYDSHGNWTERVRMIIKYAGEIDIACACPTTTVVAAISTKAIIALKTLKAKGGTKLTDFLKRTTPKAHRRAVINERSSPIRIRCDG